LTKGQPPLHRTRAKLMDNPRINSQTNAREPLDILFKNNIITIERLLVMHQLSTFKQ